MQLLVDGTELMVIGMTTVFAFLTLLVALMYTAGWFFKAFGDWFEEPQPAAALPSGTAGDDTEIAVVLAAIAAHRRDRG